MPSVSSVMLVYHAMDTLAGVFLPGGEDEWAVMRLESGSEW